ncbi:MAG: alpha/beta hydrolase [Victivallales bacterium]|nr:alpha/beta hydrolase [Victivallales bacterium]
MARKQNRVITPQDTGEVIDGTFSFRPCANGARVSLDGSFVGCTSSEDDGIEFDSRDYANGVHEFSVECDGKTNIAEFCFANRGKPKESAAELREKWENVIGKPMRPFTHSVSVIAQFDRKKFTGKLFRQANGPGSFQRVLVLYPKKQAPAPAVIIPFYQPETMSQINLATMEDNIVPKDASVAFGRLLVERGFVAVMSETYHITYIERPRDVHDLQDFSRWKRAAEKLRIEEPQCSGVGKLFADTRLLVDLASADPAVDKERIGIIGHSLGGKISFYTGCLDARIKAIVASDFGIGWGQTNWSDTWYWGRRLPFLRASNMEHSQLLAIAAPKPFLLLAGLYDNAGANAFFASARPYYGDAFGNLQLINHATGHRPPMEATVAACDFLQKHLGED